MSVTPPQLQRSLSALKSSGHSIRERLFQFKETDPSFADCFGDEAYTTETMYGKITLWRITGGLSYTAAKIQETLIKLIAEKSTDWQSRRPRNDASPFHQPPYLIQCFFVGVSKAHAAPYVTIITSVEWFSICLKDIILKGKILSAYPDWGCFRLPVDPHLTSNVTHQTLEIPCCIDEGDYEVYTPGDTVPTHISATEVEIWKGESFIAKATAGGMITVGNEHLALTVAHAFYLQRNPSPTTFDIDVSELNLLLQQHLEHTSNLMGFSEVSQCRAYLSPVSTPSSPTGLGLPPRPPTSKNKTLIGHLRYLPTIRNDDLSVPSSLDWALIRITHPNISTMNLPRPFPSHVTPDHSVMIHTISKSIDCHLISEALFGIAGCTKPQPVKVANTGGVQHGDSGAWVTRLSTQEPIGILIGSCPLLNESYILGTGDILQDIEVQTGFKASVTPNQDTRTQSLTSLNFTPQERTAITDNGLAGCSSVVPIPPYLRNCKHLQTLLSLSLDDSCLPKAEHARTLPRSQSFQEGSQGVHSRNMASTIDQQPPMGPVQESNGLERAILPLGRDYNSAFSGISEPSHRPRERTRRLLCPEIANSQSPGLGARSRSFAGHEHNLHRTQSLDQRRCSAGMSLEGRGCTMKGATRASSSRPDSKLSRILSTRQQARLDLLITQSRNSSKVFGFITSADRAHTS